MKILYFEDLGNTDLNLNSNIPQGGIYPHIKFERDPLNIFRVRVLTSSGSTGGHGGGDAKTIRSVI